MLLPFITLIMISLITHESNGGRPEFPEDIKEIVTHIHNTCVANTGVTENEIADCEKGIFADNRNLKCYMFCLMEEASFVDDDGTIDYDMLISMIPDQWRERVSSMIMSCKHLDTPEKESCEKAFDVHKCLYKNDPEIYFLF